MSYDAEIAMAQEMIAEAGCPVELVRYETERDPTMPWRAAGARETVQETSAVFVSYDERYVDGTVIQSGDRKAYVPAAGLAKPPALNAFLRLGGVQGSRWKVVHVAPLDPGGVPILYVLQVRR